MRALKRMVLFVLGAIGVICSSAVLTGAVVLTGSLVMLLPPLVLVGMIFVGVTIGVTKMTVKNLMTGQAVEIEE